MNLLPSASSSSSTGARLAGPALAAGAVLLFVGIGVVLGSQRPTAPVGDPCGLPAGVDLGALDTRDGTLIARRLLACGDLRFGRITGDDYRAAIAAIDAQWAPRREPAQPPAVVWASSVRGFSTQYSTGSWSAAQALGAPNVYPAHGDNTQAWASLGADDRDEWLEVGFDRPTAASAVEIYETFNPGAVSRVELITESGRVVSAQLAAHAAAAGTSARRVASVGCTKEPVVAVRIQIASTAVAGWNEIDAIGVVPCAR